MRDRLLWHRLQPDGLPDARCPVVPNPVWLRLPILLPTRLRQIARVVLGADDDPLGGVTFS